MKSTSNSNAKKTDLDIQQNTNGEVPVPESLSAKIQVYDGGPLVMLTFIPRYKVPGWKLSFMLSIPDLPDLLLREFDTLVGQIGEDIHEFEGAGWDKVLVISGEASWSQTEKIEAAEHKGLPLPPPVMAAGMPADSAKRY